MPKKKSVKRSAKLFIDRANEVLGFVSAADQQFGAKHRSWAYEYAILRLYREFESMMLDALVGAINNDTASLSQSTGVAFPKHLTDDVCEFLIIRDGYFDFKGRDGLIGTLKRYVPDNHYLIQAVKQPAYRDALEQLSALRNFAAHGSSMAKKRVKNVVKQQKLGSAGTWLKSQSRLTRIVDKLKDLARELEAAAPY